MTHKFTHKSDRNLFLTTFQEKNDTFSRSRYQRSPGTLRSFDQRIIFFEYFCEIEKINKKNVFKILLIFMSRKLAYLVLSIFYYFSI